MIRDFTSDTGACTFDRGTGLFTPTCEFVPDKESQAKASLMYAEYLTSVRQHSYLRKRLPTDHTPELLTVLYYRLRLEILIVFCFCIL